MWETEPTSSVPAAPIVRPALRPPMLMGYWTPLNESTPWPPVTPKYEPGADDLDVDRARCSFGGRTGGADSQSGAGENQTATRDVFHYVPLSMFRFDSEPIGATSPIADL